MDCWQQISHLPDDELTTALDGLIEAELIYRRGLPPEATYLFKHALVRDAAYESLLKEKRRAVHTRILTALETDPTCARSARRARRGGQAHRPCGRFVGSRQQSGTRTASI